MLDELHGSLVFLRSLARNPLAVGAVAPSSPKLSQLMASCVKEHDGGILEVGAGTGSITGALLDIGIRPDRLVLIERDPALASFLRTRFPGVRIRCGDAAEATRILSTESIGPVRSIVSSLPIRNLKTGDQMITVQGLLNVLAPAGELIQYTYAPVCPIPIHRLGLKAERLGRIWMNLPPASVWRFTRKPL